MTKNIDAKISIVYIIDKQGELENSKEQQADNTTEGNRTMTSSNIYIELTNGDRKYLKPSQVDIMNYDNNHGYDVWAMVDGDVELLFASKEERDEFMNDNGLIPESWPGTWEYDIECDIHRGSYDTIGGYYDKNTVKVI